jgi:hypothetical protein
MRGNRFLAAGLLMISATSFCLCFTHFSFNMTKNKTTCIQETFLHGHPSFPNNSSTSDFIGLGITFKSVPRSYTIIFTSCSEVEFLVFVHLQLPKSKRREYFLTSRKHKKYAKEKTFLHEKRKRSWCELAKL